MTAVAYLISGMVVWGGIGWLVDDFVGPETHYFAGIGFVRGIGVAVELIVSRLGA